MTLQDKIDELPKDIYYSKMRWSMLAVVFMASFFVGIIAGPNTVAGAIALAIAIFSGIPWLTVALNNEQDYVIKERLLRELQSITH